MLRIHGLLLVILSVALTACSTGGTDGNEPDVPDVPVPDSPQPDPPIEHLPINISPFVKADAGRYFVSGDKVGLFVVNHNNTGASVSLAPSGNHVDNMLYINTTQWTPATPTYWKDEKTVADLYLYYPYQESVANPCAMLFNTDADQSIATVYRSCDLLVGSTLNVSPTETAVNIEMKHVMSKVEIRLNPGAGFTDASLAMAVKSVKLNNLKTSATIDLASVSVKAAGTVEDIIPYHDGQVYKAVVVPQTTSERALISVDVNGDTYNYSEACTFERGKTHTFVITLNKTSSGINTTVEAWKDDNKDNGGTAEPM